MPKLDRASLAGAAQVILVRELRGLARELDAYPNDELVWQTAPGIANPGGTLALHLAGNIQHFVGAILGQTGYVRDRAAEFRRRGVPRSELQQEIARAIEAVERILPSLEESSLREPYPAAVGGRTVRTADFLAHLVAHTAYHVGQVDYHRRLVAGGEAVEVLSPGELPAIG